MIILIILIEGLILIVWCFLLYRTLKPGNGGFLMYGQVIVSAVPALLFLAAYLTGKTYGQDLLVHRSIQFWVGVFVLAALRALTMDFPLPPERQQ